MANVGMSGGCDRSEIGTLRRSPPSSRVLSGPGISPSPTPNAGATPEPLLWKLAMVDRALRLAFT
jgi:hypothetical protein